MLKETLPVTFQDRQKEAAAPLDWPRRFSLLVRRLFKFKMWVWLALLVVGALVYAWKFDASHFIVVRTDRDVSGATAYPLAVDLNLVGRYPSQAKSGAGYFYDDVLEYRVWVHPERGGERLNGDSDYYEAFAQYEKAEKFSKTHAGAEEPLVLVRQIESVNEPEPGHYVWDKSQRITEWQVRWLAGSKRTPQSIQDFLQHPRPARE